ncbi:hypothetical protein CSUI_003929 [Cystoisospora suis]|uniref:Uncharacterized protein n=1 Tax=Cystoisospora suis TaxID=483139 RepID=A0A2C6L359_9APIC|nr:hypothetical protein CSUI_003929 [Cystoisospora suis]
MESERITQRVAGVLQPGPKAVGAQVQGDWKARHGGTLDTAGLSKQLSSGSSRSTTSGSMDLGRPVWTRSESQGARATLRGLRVEVSGVSHPPERARSVESHLTASAVGARPVLAVRECSFNEQGCPSTVSRKDHEKEKDGRAASAETAPLIVREDSEVLHVFEDPRITYRSTVDPELIRSCTRGSGSLSLGSSTEYSDKATKEALEGKGAVLGGSGEMLWPAMQPFQDLATMVYDVFSGSTSEPHNAEEGISVSRCTSPDSDFVVTVEGSTIVSGDPVDQVQQQANSEVTSDTSGQDLPEAGESPKACDARFRADCDEQLKDKNEPVTVWGDDGDLPARLEG